MSKQPDNIEDNKANLPEVEQELSQVASNPKQNIAILAVISIIFAYVFFTFFINDDKANKNPKDTTPIPTEISKPVQMSSDEIPSIPTLPTIPKLEAPTPPPAADTPAPTPDLQNLPSLPPIDTENNSLSSPNLNPILPMNSSSNMDDEELNARREAKRKSGIILLAGTVPSKTAEQIQQEADFTYKGNMHLVLSRGKILEAIIETAISSDFGGEIKAIISRDVYSEWGKNILIPKGSKIFGNYNTGMGPTYGRVSVEWTRIDLTNGFSLNLRSPGIDSLGRAGIAGRVDNKFKERFANAVLNSAFKVALGSALDSLVKPPIKSQTAATQASTASNIRNIATGVYTANNQNPATAREVICANVTAAIVDKTSTAFSTITAACNTLRTQTGANDVEKLTSLMSSINTAADSLLINTTTNVTNTKAQDATKEAFTDLGKTAKELLVDNNRHTPSITIDQGTQIKVYVNKDYKFPAQAVQKRRLMQ